MTTTDELLDRIEELEQEQAQLRQQYEQTKEQYQQVTGLFEQFKTGSISRRAFLTSVTALAGAGFMAGSASAAPDYTNASGVAGTETQPLSSANIKQLNANSVSTDVLDVADSGVESAGTLSAGNNTRITVNFSANFSSEPVIIINPGSTGLLNPAIYHIAESVSTSSFDIRVENGSSSDQMIDHISWVALKP